MTNKYDLSRKEGAERRAAVGKTVTFRPIENVREPLNLAIADMAARMGVDPKKARVKSLVINLILEAAFKTNSALTGPVDKKVSTIAQIVQSVGGAPKRHGRK